MGGGERYLCPTNHTARLINTINSRVAKSGVVNCIIPMGFLPWEIRVAFPGGKPAAIESRHPTYGACWVC